MSPYIFCLQLQTVIRGAVLAAMSILSLVGNVLTMVAIAKDAGRTPLCTMVLHLRSDIRTWRLVATLPSRTHSLRIRWEHGGID